MFGYRTLFFIFVGLCTVINCKAQYDYFDKISSYVQTGSSGIADSVSSYYEKYSKTKTAAAIRDTYDKSISYVRSSGSKIAETASSYYDEYSQPKKAVDEGDAYHTVFSALLYSGKKIAEDASSYYDEYSQTKTAADISDAYDKTYSYLRTGGSKIADSVSSYYNEYTAPTPQPDVTEQHDKPPNIHIPEHRAEEENNACEEKLRECTIMINDISDEALSRSIVNMLLSRTHMKSRGSLFRGRIELEATASELEALEKFGLGKLTLREVAPILNNLIQVPGFDLPHKLASLIRSSITILFNLFHNLASLIRSSITILFNLFRKLASLIRSSITILFNFIVTYRNVIFTVVTLVLYLHWTLSYVRNRREGILSTGIQVIFIATFLVTWWEVSREQNIGIVFSLTIQRVIWIVVEGSKRIGFALLKVATGFLGIAIQQIATVVNGLEGFAWPVIFLALAIYWISRNNTPTLQYNEEFYRRRHSRWR